MDTPLEIPFVAVKEERTDYEDEEKYTERSNNAEMITVKVELAETEPAMRDSGRNSQKDNQENGFTVAYPSHLLENYNPAQYYIAKLSQKLNSKLNKVLSPQNENSPSGSNYFSEENRIGGDALQCLWCPANATDLEELKQHQLVCGLSPSNGSYEQSNLIDGDGVERRYACDICGKRFARNWFLKRHYVSHTNAQPFSCVVCNKGFSTAKCLKDHQITHIKNMPYICPKCNRGFPNREALREHARTHIKDMPFSCRVCGKRFLQAKNLNFHMKVHSGLTIYPCDECEKGFDTEEERATHKKQHNLVMPFKCSLCNQAFATIRHRQRHSALHDVENPRKCAYCDERFALEASYRAHLKEFHSKVSSACSNCELLANSVTCDDSEEFMCEDCDLPFLHKKCLANHLMDHQEGKVPCEKCGKEFPLNNAYHRHMLIHTGEKPFICTECKRCFSTRTILKDHMRKHWRDRPFACKVCGEKFSFNNMMAHLLSHAGGKTVLNETGNTRTDLVVNEKRHTKVDGRADIRVNEVKDPKVDGKAETEVYGRADGKVDKRRYAKVNERMDPKADGSADTNVNKRRVTKVNRRRDKTAKGRGHMIVNAKRGSDVNETRDLKVNEGKEEPRRSPRTKASLTYFEGSSDEFEGIDAFLANDAEMNTGVGT